MSRKACAEAAAPRAGSISIHNGAPLHSFLEGPAFDRDGNLFVVDVAWGRIFRIAPDGSFAVVAQYDGAPNGIAIHRDGRVFVATGFVASCCWIHGAARLTATSSPASAVQPFLGVNDLCFALNGDLYFTDQGLPG